MHVSEKGVLGGDTSLCKNFPPSIVVGQDNGNSHPIVSREAKSRTSSPNRRGGSNHSALNNSVNGHIPDAHNGLHNGFETSMDIKNNGQHGSNIGTINPVNNKESDSLHGGVNSLIVTTVQLNQMFLWHVKMWLHLTICVTKCCYIYDVNTGTCDENFELSNAMLLKDGWKRHVPYLEKHCSDFSLWKSQSDHTFGFVPLNNLVMPHDIDHISDKVLDPVQQHLKVRPSGVPNFLGERIPVRSQLNVPEWKEVFKNYWDQQLIQLVEFGFPLDFNRNSVLRYDDKNHSSAIDFPADIQAYLGEEIQHGAIMGPFDVNPIPNCHVSPIMTREKPSAPNR